MFLLKVRPFNLLIDIVNQPWRGFKPPKRQLPEQMVRGRSHPFVLVVAQ
jgi:hypothetical protein